MLWTFLHLWGLVLTITGDIDPITKIGNDLNDTSLWEVDDVKKGKKGCKRVYVFSETDSIVPHDAVRLRSREAREKGWDVVLEEFRGSRHVAHALSDKERYWKIVKDVMED